MTTEKKIELSAFFLVSKLEIVFAAVITKPEMTRNTMLPVVDLVMDDLDDVFVAENPEVTRVKRDPAWYVSVVNLIK